MKIDIKEAIQLMGGSTELYYSFIQKFLEKYEHIDLELEENGRKKDYVHIEEMIHNMKGISGNLGAHDFFQVLTDADQKYKDYISGIGEEEEISSLIEKIINWHKETCIELKTILKHQDQDFVKINDINESILPLYIALKSCNYMKIIEELEDFEKTMNHIERNSPKWQIIKEFIDEEEYKKAEEMIKDVCEIEE